MKLKLSIFMIISILPSFNWSAVRTTNSNNQTTSTGANSTPINDLSTEALAKLDDVMGLINLPHGIVKRPNLYCVVLCGGTGTRLWPYSRKERPKQLLTLNSSKTLIEETLNRVRPLVASNEQLWVITTKDHAAAVRENVNDQVGNIMVEGASRNTGPACIFACLEIYKKDPNALVLFLPADAYIPEHEYGKVLDYLDSALTFVETNNRISIFGMTPTRPETGYGYIEFDRTEGDAAPFFKVKKFHEKPNKATAEEYLRLGTFAWNITMFCAPVSRVLDECRAVCPKLVVQVEESIQGKRRYDEIDSIAIEPALMEKSKHIWVLPVSFEWCDVGNVGIFLSLKESIKQQQVVAIDAKNNLVDVPDKIVALIGVNDLCIVQTKDALLITKRDEAEKVRYVVQHLQQNNLSHYL